MKKPEFITFTGIDDATDLIAARALATEFPVEYGVLFSPERQGNSPRYPSWSTISKILLYAIPGSRHAAHLCGGYSRLLLASAATTLDSVLLNHFSRVQINTHYVGLNVAILAEWAESVQAEPILQCRGAFPAEAEVSWLFDASGGRGLTPDAWPQAPCPAPGTAGVVRPPLIGYAGGLSPSNISTALPAIAAAAGDSPYWIDMESGVRDADDRFDLSKCRAVCEAVFG